MYLCFVRLHNRNQLPPTPGTLRTKPVSIQGEVVLPPVLLHTLPLNLRETIAHRQRPSPDNGRCTNGVRHCKCQTTSLSNSARNLSKTWVCTCTASLLQALLLIACCKGSTEILASSHQKDCWQLSCLH